MGAKPSELTIIVPWSYPSLSALDHKHTALMIACLLSLQASPELHKDEVSGNSHKPKFTLFFSAACILRWCRLLGDGCLYHARCVRWGLG